MIKTKFSLENFFNSKKFQNTDCICIFNPFKKAIYFILKDKRIYCHSRDYNGFIDLKQFYIDFVNCERAVIMPIKENCPQGIYFIEDKKDFYQILEITKKTLF